MSPLLLVLDGVLSQDEERVTQALREITLAHVLPLAIVNNCSPSDLLATTTTTTTILESNASSSSSDALLNLLRALLDAAPSLAGIASSHDGSLPLHFAASLGDVRVASLLLDRFPSAASTRNDKGKIPLMYAAREGRLDLVRMFLERNPETAALASHKNKLALHFAAGDGHYEVCQLLLQVHPEGASVVTQKGKIAMHLAARWGYVDLCELFHRVSPSGVKSLDWDGSLPLHDACRQGQVYTSQFLLQMYPEGVRVMNLRGEVPIFPAVRAGNLDLVDQLIRAWTLGGRHVLRNVSEDDQVDEWSWETMELLLRGAVDKLEPCEDRLEAVGGPFVAVAPTSASSVSSSTPNVASSASTDETDSSSNHRSSPVLHANKKRPYSADLAKDHQEGPPGSIETKMGAMDLDVANVGPPASSQFIPLHAAIECGASLPVVLAVLDERPQDVLAVDDRGRTALHWAACYANIRRQDALHAAAAAAAAAASSQASASSALPKKKKKKNKTGSPAVAASAANAVPEAESPDAKAQLELVERVVTPEAARVRDANHRLPLHLALESRASLPVVACLLRAHPKSGVLPCNLRVEEEERSASSSSTAKFRPFHWACKHDCDLDVIFHLLRADPEVLEAR